MGTQAPPPYPVPLVLGDKTFLSEEQHLEFERLGIDAEGKQRAYEKCKEDREAAQVREDKAWGEWLDANSALHTFVESRVLGFVNELARPPAGLRSAIVSGAVVEVEIRGGIRVGGDNDVYDTRIFRGTVGHIGDNSFRLRMTDLRVVDVAYDDIKTARQVD